MKLEERMLKPHEGYQEDLGIYVLEGTEGTGFEIQSQPASIGRFSVAAFDGDARRLRGGNAYSYRHTAVECSTAADALEAARRMYSEFEEFCSQN